MRSDRPGLAFVTSTRRLELICGGLVLLLFVAAAGQTASDASHITSLGRRLFNDERFSSPFGDLNTSCATCHLLDQDPQGPRVFTDFFNRSWVPWRAEDPRRVELRNSPTILDCATMPRLHFDGEFASLEDLVKGTVSGRPMGWVAGEANRAFDHVYSVLLKDAPSNPAASYRNEFKAAFGVELDSAGRDRAVDLMAQALGAYMRTLNASRTSPYDAFVAANGLPAAPARGESAQSFADRILAQVSSLDDRRELKLAPAFDRRTLAGLRVFMATRGSKSTGNCVSCHAPPSFTDNSFHNMGVSQAEYDAVHGDGRFAALAIPNASAAVRPSTQFREPPSQRNPSFADLGFWNFIDLKTSTLRRPGESDDQLLGRMVATFKTPTLRNLTYTYPYLHNGAFNTIDDTLGELKRLSELARAGQLRAPDEDLLRVAISDDDIISLTSFLRSLNDLRLGPSR